MNNQRAVLCFFAYVALAMAAMITLRADERSPVNNAVPDGAADQISDWALAGVIWSDASLTKKLASESAELSESPIQQQRLQAIANKSSEIVSELESFGWKQVQRSATLPEQHRSGAALPNPKAVGADLADSINRPDLDSRAQQPANREPVNRNQTTAREPALDSSIKRFDTETPAGVDDPGLDDERTGGDLPLDFDQYRVDDYIDETPAEARNRADAIEDAVEGAIAAAAGRPGMERPGIGHISEREGQTLSATLPYAQDSIYDSDDYDPDVDYDVDNPLGADSSNPASVEVGDRDDDIDLRVPARAINGEDELIAAMAREDQSNGRRTTRSVEIDRYTSERSKHLQDANWVQFHLNVNQATWREFTTRENVLERTGDAIVKLKTDAAAAMNATTNSQLKAILQSIMDLPTNP